MVANCDRTPFFQPGMSRVIHQGWPKNRVVWSVSEGNPTVQFQLVVSSAWRDGLTRLLALACCGGLLMAGSPAMAQTVQRSFLNLGFEQPRINGPSTSASSDGDAGCSRTVAASDVNGWETTEDQSNPAGFWGSPASEMCPQAAGFPGPPNTGNVIQMFYENYQGSGTGSTGVGGVILAPTDTPARLGEQFAELNADNPERLY